jgi:hypothetical protein
MGFSAMLTEEYILVVLLTIHQHIGLDEYSRATEYNIIFTNFTQQRFGLNEHRISAQQKALIVRRHITISMENFIDTSFEDREWVQEILEDLKIVYPNLCSCNLNVSFKGYHLLKDFLKAEVLETVKIERSNSLAYVAFIQTHYAVPLRRDGSASSSEVKAYVIVNLPADFGNIFIKNETFRDKMQELLNPLEIKIEGDTSFNRKFLLLAKDKDKAYPLFNSTFRSILNSAKIKDIYIEVSERTMLIGNQKLAGDDELSELIKVGLDISCIRYNNGG